MSKPFAKLQKQAASSGMSKPKIDDWVLDSAHVSDGEEDGPWSWQRDEVTEDWDTALDYASRILLKSKNTARLEFLKEELLSLARVEDLDLSQSIDLFKLLTETYPRYPDGPSRAAVQTVILQLASRDNERDEPLGVTEKIIGWLANEVARISRRGNSSSCAPGDLYVLFSWACGLYTTCLQKESEFTTTQAWRALVGTLAILLEMLLSTSTKESMQKGTVVLVRRALRSRPAKLPTVMDTLLTQAKTSTTPLLLVPFLGVAVDVTLHLKDEALRSISPEIKDSVTSLYTTTILMAKVAVPAHVLASFNSFISTFVTPTDLFDTILPTAEKALLRSPEYSLNVISHFFVFYLHPVGEDIFKRLLTVSLNSAKSANVTIRAGSVDLFKIALEKSPAPSNQELAVNEILALPKSNKTSGPDHRLALFSMLATMPPSAQVSHTFVQTGVTLLAKETHEPSVNVLAQALPDHVVFLLRGDTPIPTDTTVVIAKEMNNSRPVIRRAFCILAGRAFWQYPELESAASATLAKALLPAFEANLRTVAANPLNATGGVLEGYIAVAVLLGPYSRSSKFDDAISHNASIQGLASSATKPSFLLWDKVYHKHGELLDETWLLRASEAALGYMKAELTKTEHLRTQLGSIFLHLAVDSPSPDIRKAVAATLTQGNKTQPQLLNRIVREALTSYISREKVDIADISAAKRGRTITFLVSCANFDEGLEASVREALLVELVVVAHHALTSGPSRQTWIELCQKGGADPHDLVNRHLDKLFQIVLKASTDPKTASKGFAEASYRTVTTLAFVSPVEVLPRIIEQLREDINPSVVNSLTETDFGIWATPQDTTYVDVLTVKKSEAQAKKGKDHEIERWEAELRKTLADKKAAATTTLSKPQQALVKAQLEKEDVVRQRVTMVKAHLERGLQFVRSLVAADVHEFRSYISSVAALLLEGALDKGSLLVGISAVDTYLDLAKCCSERLDTIRSWVGVATLRSLEIKSVPEELSAEPLNSLVLRVLYRLRSLSEQAPFDASTFSYAFPLLGQILVTGGIDVGEEDDPLEQVTLALDVIKFHCGEFADGAFPRTQTMENLLHIIRQQPKLSKSASSALVDLGQAIYPTASREETDALLHGTLLQETYVRTSCLQALQPFDLTELDWSPELWIACHDSDEQNSRLAHHIWEDNGMDVPEPFLGQLLEFLAHDHAYVRASTAAAIAEGVEHWPQSIHATITVLEDFYREKAKILAPEFDAYGMVIAQSLDRTDPWPARAAAALTFELLTPYFTEEEVVPFFTFLIYDEALGDRIPEVRRGMLTAGTSVIDEHGASRLAGLIGMFEEHLASGDATTEASDHIKEAVVILFGRVARHLDSTDTRIPTIVNRLVEALKTPAEQVQIAVSDCLVPLVKNMRERVPDLVESLLAELFHGAKYAARRGAAYGVAGVVKGIGISGIKDFNIIERLRGATEDKKAFEPRQGAMFAFETLSNTLGRLFEPYIPQLLPLLLSSFGDTVNDVREATQDAARVIMGNMSGYGVKLILPSLLYGLDEKQWRTKKGSIELLGMMAYCSPRQLSLSLPIVIPRLTDVLTDSHAQVRVSANKSLKQFGEVISNPEIKSLVPILLKALVDPVKTPNALSSLLKTSFMHYIDQSSLALVVPIIERGLRERGAETKKKAVQIVGNLASLTDSKDFVPYLSGLLPLMHQVLVDPVPEARATAAKALGTLVERLGEVHFPDLVPSLLRTLKTDTSGVDRQGAAQGLSEVLSGLGMERLEGLLPDIIANAQSPRSTVREGFMSLLVFLPATFGTRFQPHLPKIIAPILSGISDTEEYVREAAMRAGRMVVNKYSTKAIDLLLPELEHGMFDPGWRIRQSSITLVGELLFKITGISGKAEIEEDEVVVEANVAETSRQALVDILGTERRDRILSALYLVRQDGVNVVRLASVHIWKALVHNTPRTVREILPELLNQVVTLIASGEFEQQETASRTSAELCRKFGDRILGDIITILRTKSASPDAKTREGVCLVLSEIMENSTEGQREGHDDDIILIVRQCLVDDEAEVRAAAAQTFDILQEHLGVKAIDQTIPTLLEALRQPGQSAGTALQALKEVMSVRATTIFPVLIPTLIATPMTVFNARALASLVTVAGSALSRRLTVILTALVKVLEEEKDEELLEAVEEGMRASFASVEDAEGLNTLMMSLIGWAKHDSPRRRVSACKMFAMFCEESEMDDSIYRTDWIRQLVSLLEDPQVPVHTAAWHALDAFVKSLPKDELEPLVVPLRRSIETTGSPGHHVPGFSLPKGVSPMVPIIIAGLTTGSNEQREQAAYAIGDLVERTEESAIKPFVVPFTGPLIRVATQATTYPPAVKTAILSALTSMLERIPTFVKPFFPQLQRTFVKSASDPTSVVVRTKAAQALGVLMRSQPRVDPVITELITGARSNDGGIASSLILALSNVVRSAGQNVGEKSRESCVELVSEAFRNSRDGSDSYIQAVSALFASLGQFPELVEPVVQANLITGTTPSVLSSQCILSVLDPPADGQLEIPNVFRVLGLLKEVAQKVLESTANEKPNIGRPAREARDILKDMQDDSLQGLF